MEQPRSPSRGSSVWSEATEQIDYGWFAYEGGSPSRGSSVWSEATDQIDYGWFAHEGEPPRPAASSSSSENTGDSAEPDSSSDSGPVEVGDDFSGPADSSSWWNFEDDVGNDGPADSTTP